MASFVGKYQFENAENIDEYLKGLGVGLVFRKVQGVAKPIIEITHDRKTDAYTYKIESVFRTRTFTFKMGQAFPDETYDLRKCQTTVIWDGESKLILNQVCDEGTDVKVIQELTETGLKISMESGEFQASQSFKRSPAAAPTQ